MTDDALEDAFSNAPDSFFRVRATSEYRAIKSWVRNHLDLDHARILDFGCGKGIAAASLALRHPGSEVIGMDVIPCDQDFLSETLKVQVNRAVPNNLQWATTFPGQAPDYSGAFNLIYAWSVFEHMRKVDILPTLQKLHSMLLENGLLFIQIDPLYFSPRGSHLTRYFSTPWHHLLLSVDELQTRVLTADADEVAREEWTQFVELNRMTGRQILDCAKEAGLCPLREQFFQTDLEPPEELLSVYQRDALVTTGFMALFR